MGNRADTDTNGGTERLERAEAVLALLSPRHPNLKPLLHYKNPFELMVATVLSAQCTDARVNTITPALFARWPTPEALSRAESAELEAAIYSAGFFRAKAKNLIGLSRLLVERFNSAVPATMEELTLLPGIGRKSAGVLLAACFGKGAIIVDTHFGRVCRRLGFAQSESPEKLEREIAAFLPESQWTPFSMLINFHGRDFCASRSPRCEDCPLLQLCPFGRDRLGITAIR